MIRRLFIAAALAAALPFDATADDTVDEAREFVSGLADRVAAAAMRGPDAPRDEVRADFRSMLEDGFDVPVIAQFVIGRYWRGAEEADRARFLELFESIIVETYSNQIASFSGTGISVADAERLNDKVVLVMTAIEREGSAEPFMLGWRVRTEGEMRIIDVVVEGVSLVQTQRSEYASVMRSEGGLAGLNAALEEQLAKLAADTGDAATTPEESADASG
ncbi:MAG: ABC transporter substrate-binding protein [Pseudomonadota bacterium]